MKILKFIPRDLSNRRYAVKIKKENEQGFLGRIPDPALPVPVAYPTQQGFDAINEEGKSNKEPWNKNLVCVPDNWNTVKPTWHTSRYQLGRYMPEAEIEVNVLKTNYGLYAVCD